MDKLIIISGPTASGKSRISVELAKETNAEIISADSMQVYRLMDIGSAKIKSAEMQGIRHHLIDCVEPTEDFNVYRYKKLADKAIADILSRQKLPVLTGGTGFYIQAVLYDVDFKDGKTDYRRELERLYETEGAGFLHDELFKVDPESASMIHENNVKRVIRALEYFHETGDPISLHNKKMREKEARYDFKYYVLTMPRDRLYERIDRRVDEMLKEGLVDEVRRLMDLGLTDRNVSMQGLGYKEIYRYLTGSLDYDEAVRIIKRDSRHYAKRQLTWFKRERNTQMIDLSNFDYDLSAAAEYLIGDIG